MSDVASHYSDHLATLSRAYDQILADHSLDAVVIAAGRAALKNRFDDQYRPLAITPAFAHWLPLPESEAVLVIRSGKQPRLIRVVTTDFWETVPRCESDHFWPAFEVLQVGDPAAVAEHLPKARVAVIASDELPFAAPGPINPPALVAAIDAVRTRKPAYENACLAWASRRAVKGHRATAAKFTRCLLHLVIACPCLCDSGKLSPFPLQRLVVLFGSTYRALNGAIAADQRNAVAAQRL